MATLRERCKAFYQQQSRNAILRQGDPVEDLVAFVVAENGRKAADPVLDDALPLCLYFTNHDDREEFVAAVRQSFPHLMTKRVP